MTQPSSAAFALSWAFLTRITAAGALAQASQTHGQGRRHGHRRAGGQEREATRRVEPHMRGYQ